MSLNQIFRSGFRKSPSEVQIMVGTNQWKSGVKYAPKEFIIHWV